MVLEECRDAEWGAVGSEEIGEPFAGAGVTCAGRRLLSFYVRLFVTFYVFVTGDPSDRDVFFCTLVFFAYRSD